MNVHNNTESSAYFFPKKNKIEKSGLENELETWVQDENIQGEKDTAKKLILKACSSKAHFLDLQNLHLSSLPSAIGQLIELRQLCLSNNPLENLPSNFENLIHLENLDLQNCCFKSVPIELLTLPNLKSVNYKGSPIDSLFSKEIA